MTATEQEVCWQEHSSSTCSRRKGHHRHQAAPQPEHQPPAPLQEHEQLLQELLQPPPERHEQERQHHPHDRPHHQQLPLDEYFTSTGVTAALAEVLRSLQECPGADPLPLVAETLDDIARDVPPLVRSMKRLRHARGNTKQLTILVEPLYTHLAAAHPGLAQATWLDLSNVVGALCCRMDRETVTVINKVLEEEARSCGALPDRAASTQASGAGASTSAAAAAASSASCFSMQHAPIAFSRFARAVGAALQFEAVVARAEAVYARHTMVRGAAIPLATLLRELFHGEGCSAAEAAAAGGCEQALRRQLDIAHSGRTLVRLSTFAGAVFDITFHGTWDSA